MGGDREAQLGRLDRSVPAGARRVPQRLLAGWAHSSIHHTRQKGVPASQVPDVTWVINRYLADPGCGLGGADDVELFHYGMPGAGVWTTNLVFSGDRRIRIVPLRVTGLRLGPSRRRWRAVRRPPGASQRTLDARHPVAEGMHLSAQLPDLAAQDVDLPAQALALCLDGVAQRLALRLNGALKRLALRSQRVPEGLSLRIESTLNRIDLTPAGWRLARGSQAPIRRASRPLRPRRPTAWSTRRSSPASRHRFTHGAMVDRGQPTGNPMRLNDRCGYRRPPLGRNRHAQRAPGRRQRARRLPTWDQERPARPSQGRCGDSRGRASGSEMGCACQRPKRGIGPCLRQ